MALPVVVPVGEKTSVALREKMLTAMAKLRIGVSTDPDADSAIREIFTESLEDFTKPYEPGSLWRRLFVTRTGDRRFPAISDKRQTSLVANERLGAHADEAAEEDHGRDRADGQVRFARRVHGPHEDEHQYRHRRDHHQGHVDVVQVEIEVTERGDHRVHDQVHDDEIERQLEVQAPIRAESTSVALPAVVHLLMRHRPYPLQKFQFVFACRCESLETAVSV
jgi:hypothetical protein